MEHMKNAYIKWVWKVDNTSFALTAFWIEITNEWIFQVSKFYQLFRNGPFPTQKMSVEAEINELRLFSMNDNNLEPRITSHDEYSSTIANLLS